MKTKNSSNVYEDSQHEEQNHEVVQLSDQPIESNATTSGSKPDSPASRQELDGTVTTVEDQFGEAQSAIYLPSAEPPPEQSGAITTTSPPASFPKKHTLNLRAILVSAGIIALFVGSATGGLNVRKAQYEKMDQARISLNEACHTETFPNIQTLDLARQDWARAENLLETIPPLPGLGIRDAQELRSTFERCKQNLDATSYFFEAANTSRDARNAVNQVQGLPEESWTVHLNQLDLAIEHLKLTQTIPQDLPIFRASQQRLEEYRGLRGKMQSRLNEERQAVEDFQASEKLHEQFAAKQAFFDATSRSNAEQALVSAIGYLQKVPSERTTVSATAIQTLERYYQELSDFRREPVLQNLRSLAANFAQLSRDLQANLTFDNNTLATLDRLTQQLTELQQNPAISSHSSMVYFTTALADYQFAKDLWQNCNEQTPESELCSRNQFGFDNLYIGDTSRFYNRLIDYYGVNPSWPVDWIRQQDALDSVFDHAQWNIERAMELVES